MYNCKRDCSCKYASHCSCNYKCKYKSHSKYNCNYHLPTSCHYDYPCNTYHHSHCKCQCRCKSPAMLFSMTNESNNQVVAIQRNPNGSLHSAKTYATGGSGSGEQRIDPLESQGSIVVSENGYFLFVVNAGSNSISSFKICDDELILADVVPSCGIFPNSLTVYKDTLYVCNRGNDECPANISGYYIQPDGQLVGICGSNVPLGNASVEPACIFISPCGTTLSVTDKGNNTLLTFNVTYDGRLECPVVTPSCGNVPFGATYVYDDVLVVSEAAANGVSSYFINYKGGLCPISCSVSDGQQGVCWISVTPNRRYAYSSNAGSGTITTFTISKEGMLNAIESVPSIPDTQATPLDSAVESSGYYFYVLNGESGYISVFYIEPDGLLTLLEVFTDTHLPTIGAQGLAVL